VCLASKIARVKLPIFIDFDLVLGATGGESPASSSSEASSGCCGGSGYLEDAVAHWSDRCKRRRTEEEEAPPPRWPAMASEDLQSLLQVNKSLCCCLADILAVELH
jgi:hypothetical protein